MALEQVRRIPEGDGKSISILTRNQNSHKPGHYFRNQPAPQQTTNKSNTKKSSDKTLNLHMANYMVDRPHNNANKIPSVLSYKIASPPPPPHPPSSPKQPQQQRQFYLIQKSCHATDRPATNQSKGDTSAPSCSSQAING